MKVAFFSDIHSNLPALEEVVAHIEKQKVDATFCLGDLVGYGPHPNEVIETITSRKIPTIMGNCEDGWGTVGMIGVMPTGAEGRGLGERSLL